MANTWPSRGKASPAPAMPGRAELCLTGFKDRPFQQVQKEKHGAQVQRRRPLLGQLLLVLNLSPFYLLPHRNVFILFQKILGHLDSYFIPLWIWSSWPNHFSPVKRSLMMWVVPKRSVLWENKENIALNPSIHRVTWL